MEPLYIKIKKQGLNINKLKPILQDKLKLPIYDYNLIEEDDTYYKLIVHPIEYKSVEEKKQNRFYVKFNDKYFTSKNKAHKYYCENINKIPAYLFLAKFTELGFTTISKEEYQKGAKLL